MSDTRTTNTPSPCSEPSNDAKGLEELPSGRWRVKLRDPTRPGRWMPGGSFASRAEAVDYRNGLLSILAGVLRDEDVVDEGSLQSFGGTA